MTLILKSMNHILNLEAFCYLNKKQNIAVNYGYEKHAI